MELTLPEWLVLALPWIALAALAGLAAVAVGVWALVRRVQRLERYARRLDAIEELRVAVVDAARTVQEIDVRSLEHLLGEVRDGERRLADAVMDAVERRSDPISAHEGDARAGAAPVAVPMSERVVNRLLAMGYRRVQVLDDREALEGMTDGEVRIEAFRDGIMCKGRVLVRGGQLVDAEVRTAHSIFP